MVKAFSKLLAAILALIIVICSLCSCDKSVQRYSESYTDVFDTVCSFSAYCDSKEEFDKASLAVHQELLRLHSLFDIYNEYDSPNLCTLNKNKVLESADYDIAELVNLGLVYGEKTEGVLNIAMGSILTLWHDARSKGYIPDISELMSASEHMDISLVGIDQGTVSLGDSEMSLDVGAVAKGYACESVARIIKDMGIESYAIDLGGNVKIGGTKPDGDNWVIGIRDPDGGIFTTVGLCDMSVVTSGDYERFAEIDGVRYSHIIDPRTLYPAKLYRSVTVICDNSAAADALSTALFCMDVESGKKLAEQENAEVLWIGIDGEVYTYGSRYF